jgi:charged multivesicular body protein 5
VYVPPKAAAPAPRPAPPSLDSAVNNSNLRISNLEARAQKCETDLANYKREMARQPKGSASYQSFRRRAVDTLREKKRIEQQLGLAGNMANNLRTVQDTKYMLQDTQQSAAALKGTVGELQREQAKINVDELQDLHDQMGDIVADTQEVQEIMGTSFAVDGMDESEFDAELDGLEAEIGYSDNVAMATPSYLPPVAHGAPQYGAVPSYQPPNPAGAYPSAPYR